jgi:hypothetical protein
MQSISFASCSALQRRVHNLLAENESLRRQRDTFLRAGKRQAAPFAKLAAALGLTLVPANEQKE